MLTGWKDITEHTGFSRNTLLKLVEEENFPLQYIASKPTITEQAISKWFDNRLEKSSESIN